MERVKMGDCDGKTHQLVVLDGLRGFCALCVVLLHLTEAWAPKVIPHGYFPVEFFLTLTGFMFVYAYDGHWKDMTVAGFFKRRILRMHPLVILGSVAALIAMCLSPGLFDRFGTGSVPALGWVFLYSCTFLPAPTSWGHMHLLQGPLWTMQYIYVANTLYALVLRHLKTWMLAALALAAGVLTCWMALRLGRLEAGWRLTEGHVSVAFTRMAFPVLVGMVIARLGWRIPLGRLSLPLAVAALAAVFFTPHLSDKMTSGLFDAAVAIVVMPLVIMMAVGGRIESPAVAAACRWLGKFSFPLYATHFQFRVVMIEWMREHPHLPTSDYVLFGIGAVAVMLAVAYAAMRMVDMFDAWRKRKSY